TSDLKGNVEGPGHYFQATDKAWKDLDNLLLTQGWVAYTWKDVFNPPVPQYAAESQFTVQGKVTNVFNKGVPETGIMLTSIRPLIIKDTLTRKDGSFTFNDLPLSDTLSFFIQAKNKNNKSFNVGLEVDEFKPPVYTSANLRLLPWYVNTDTLLLKYVSTIAEQKQEELKLQKGTNVLSEVVITAKKIIKGSRNLNGAGNADIILDEKDMAHYRNLTLYELLVKRFKYIYTTRVNGIAIYKYMQRRIVFVIDGVPASPPESYMENITAEDIKGIEIMDSFNYIYPTYITKFEVAWKIQPYIFILEITTRSGHGAFAYMKNIPGTYWYRPMLFTSSKQFYSPKYTVKSPITLTDLRSTIHWAPNIVTDKEGKAFVSFYSADKVGSYSVIMEGSDMNGNIGRQTGTITIK
ncbi:MAG TPA: hypothetical protein DIT07_16475, partial [Sphingobacteriaceae bacterium]|nr:hypothetical protein [Sphingobacteriaceae bacterium]